MAPPQYLPCSGDIDSCVYTAHTDYYCMNGNKPDYTPQLLQPTWPSQPAYQNVSTIAGNFIDAGTNFTTNVGGAEPFVSLKLFPNVFAVSVKTNIIFSFAHLGDGKTLCLLTNVTDDYHYHL